MPDKITDHQVSRISFVLYMLLLLDFFLHTSSRIPGTGALRPTLVLVILISASLVFQKEKLGCRAKEPMLGAILALIWYFLISLPLVKFPGSVLNTNAINYAKAVVYFFFTAYIVDSEKRLRIFLFVFIGCQVIRVLEPLFLHITEDYWGGRTYIGSGEFTGRLAGAPADIINPNELGFVIVTAIPFLHYLLFRNGKILSLIYLSLMPCFFYALILTMSRGALLALFVVAWMIFKKSKQKFMLFLIAIAIAITGWGVMTPLQKDRYISLIDSDTVGAKTVDGRLKGMGTEFELGFERPIFGHGVGTTQEARYHSYGGYYASHNMYAELIIEIGLVGAFFFFRYIREIFRSLRKNIEYLSEQNFAEEHFYSRLSNALKAVFWMFIVYSFNYMGLSMYYWYLFAGAVLSFSRVLRKYRQSNMSEINVTKDEAITNN